MIIDIGEIGNAYGGLEIKKGRKGKFYWTIQGCEGGEWEEIPETLYCELLTFELDRANKNNQGKHS